MADKTVPQFDAPKGHWERDEIVEFHDRILRVFDHEWIAPNHALSLPVGWWLEPKVRAIRGEMISWLRECVGDARNFGFKDPRTTLMLPLWQEICATLDFEPRFILCIRSPVPVAYSLAKRGDVPDLRDGEHRWLTYNAQAAVGIGGAPVCVLPYDAWFDDGMPNLRRLCATLDIDAELLSSATIDAVADIVSPELRHHIAKLLPRGAPLTEALHRCIVAAADAEYLGADAREMASSCCRFAQFVEPQLKAAIRTASLENEIRMRDELIAQAAIREGTLRSELDVAVSRVAGVADEIDALKRELTAERERPLAAPDDAGSEA